jgi:hypothetical protein
MGEGHATCEDAAAAPVARVSGCGGGGGGVLCLGVPTEDGAADALADENRGDGTMMEDDDDDEDCGSTTCN